MPDVGHVILRDSTLREGLDVPNVKLFLEERLFLTRVLRKLGLEEAEVLAPARVDEDLKYLSVMRQTCSGLRFTGLLYAASADLERQSRRTAKCLDRTEILVAASQKRKPHGWEEKRSLLMSAIDLVSRDFQHFGAGFPNATQIAKDELRRLVDAAIASNVDRITIYDTNGSSDPFNTFRLIESIVKLSDVPVFFHGHNDLGMATANTLAAVEAGAAGVDVTLLGLGDRAGNCSLEQIAMCLQVRGYETGINFGYLNEAARQVAKLSGMDVGPLSPVVGEYVFSHVSPGHLEDPELFYAFDPKLVEPVEHLQESE